MQATTGEQAEEGYITQGGQMYAPADFTDAGGNDARPFNSLSSTINNVSLYHINNIVDKAQQSKAWRRKVREIIQNHQERILQFMTIPVPNDHPLKTARTLIQKYGKNSTITYDIHRPAPQLMKDYIVDLSGEGITAINEYIKGLENTRVSDTPIQRQMNITKTLLDYMRDTGDELIRLDQNLQNVCIHLDTVIEKVTQLTSLESPDIDGFEEMMESYIQKQFEKHPIEKIYWDYLHTMQKYHILRDIMTSQRIMSAREPLCCVCMTEAVVIAFAPCGHTFCSGCAKRAVTCYVCRAMVQSRVKLFFT
jgi:hypothetical protein